MPVLSLGSPLVTIGDSITANAFQQNNAQDRTFSGLGYVAFVLAGVNHRLKVSPTGNLAVTGNSIGQVATSLGASGATLNALAPDAIIGMYGTNNLNDAFTDAQLTALYDSVFTLLLASPMKRYFHFAITPRYGASVLTATGERQRQFLNDYARKWCETNTPRTVFIDLDELNLQSTEFQDGLHPNNFGAMRIGAVGAQAVAQHILPGNIITDTTGLDLYTLNTTLAGGTTSATSWTTSGAGGGATIAYSKDGTDRQRVLISGNYSGTALQISLDQYTTVAAVGKTPPDGITMEAILDYEIAAVPTNVSSIWPLFGLGTAGFANLGQGQGVSADYAQPLYPMKMGRFQQRSIAVAKSAGATNYITSRIIIGLVTNGSSSPVALDLRINKFEFRRLT